MIRAHLTGKKGSYKLKIFSFLVLLTLGLSAVGVDSIFAQVTDYKLLAPIPLDGAGSGPSYTSNASTYLQGLFKLIIGVATALAVIMIVIGGVQYIGSEAFSSKSDAKNRIQNAFIGLAIAMGAWMILFTVNPRLVEFKLEIPVIDIKKEDGSGGGGGGGGGPVGCQGDCPHSYQRGGVTIKYKDCASCTKADSFGFIVKEKIVNGTEAQINTALGNKLKSLKETSGNPGFRVTETWPPTVNHANQKQYNGTSVDVSLLAPSPLAIQTFLNNATKAGLKAVYEVKTSTEKKNLVDFGIPPVSILVVPRITGAHFSIE